MPNHSSLLPSVYFLAGLTATGAFAIYLDGGLGKATQSVSWSVLQTAQNEPQPARDLSAEDLLYARTAWAYFDKNYQPATGLIDSVQGFPAGTLWDQGSYLLGMIAARSLGLISQQTFDQRTSALLTSFTRLALFDGRLPNKVYSTETLDMVDYDGALQPDGIGWSALDIARMLSALRVLELHHPHHGAHIRELLSNWDLSAMARDGRMMGSARLNGEAQLLQEGRIGYEQYGARSAAMWGLDVLVAANAAPIMRWHDLDGIEIPIDLRSARQFDAITPVASDPFFLQAIEMGFTEESKVLAERVFEAQRRRFNQTGQLTMVSESNIDQPPHFLYNSLFGNGTDWAVVSEKGEHYPELRTISLKSAFAWDAIYASTYSQQVLKTLLPLATSDGWPSGTYEADGRVNEIYTANTNGVVLQALYYKAHGPMMQLP